MHRKPRFRRVDIFHHKLTERDIELVRQLSRFRFLTTEHFRQLVKGSGQGIGRRLQTLFHTGYLDRPRAQIDYFHRGGSRPIVYSLSRNGADLLARRLGTVSGHIDWTAKRLSASRLFIEHALRVADFMVSLEAACRETDIVRLSCADEIAASLSRKSRADIRWSVPLTYRGEAERLSIVPDEVFALEFKDSGRRICYFVEVDRATMPVRRKRLKQTSVHRKFLAYHATWQQKLLSGTFRIPRFRVLTITSSEKRVQHLSECARSLADGHGLFLFSTHASLAAAAENVLSAAWKSVDSGSRQTLLSF